MRDYNPRTDANRPLFEIHRTYKGKRLEIRYVPVGEEKRELANQLPFRFAVGE